MSCHHFIVTVFQTFRRDLLSMFVWWSLVMSKDGVHTAFTYGSLHTVKQGGTIY
jgi:hypothetical protein